MEIFKNKDSAAVIHQAKESLNDELAKTDDSAILLLLSGGSTLKLLPDINTKLFGPRLTISILDERYSKEPNINNFAQLQNILFYKEALQKGSFFIDTKVTDEETLEGLAQRFEATLRNWKKANPQGKIIATQGIGADGHTAGIMPYPENPDLFKNLFEDKEKWVVGYDATLSKNQYPLRVTTTFPFLRSIIDVTIVYIAGEEKKAALQKVMSEDGSLAETPARIIKEMKSVRLFSDIY